MAIFNCYVSSPEGISRWYRCHPPKGCLAVGDAQQKCWVLLRSYQAAVGQQPSFGPPSPQTTWLLASRSVCTSSLTERNTWSATYDMTWFQFCFAETNTFRPLGFRKSAHHKETSPETSHQWLGFGFSLTTNARQFTGQPTSMVWNSAMSSITTEACPSHDKKGSPFLWHTPKIYLLKIIL